MITKQLLRDWNACWSDDRLVAAFGSRTEVTPRDVANDESISLDDRLWVLCRCLWYLDESAARCFAIGQASTVTHLAGDEDDQAIHAGLLNDMMQIEDLPVEQREAAWEAAREAAWEAAREAAWEAAWGAARGAAWGAARGAAWGAAREAAWEAAREAAWEAAREAALQKSIASAIEWLGEYAEGWKE